ncbi:MAG: DUF6734 family protein [bacterium]
MKAIQTLYLYSDDCTLESKMSYINPLCCWMSMALSCVLLKRHFEKVVLYCNEAAKSIIIDTLHIPYDEFVIIPAEAIPRNSTLWASPKIYTYSLQKEPFVHVDNDCFMFDKPEILTSVPLFCQNIEYDDQDSYKKIIAEFKSVGGNLNENFDKYITSNNNEHLTVINAGILAFNDIEFLERYVKEVKLFFDSNYEVLDNYRDGSINFLYEQLFCKILLDSLDYKLGCFTDGDYLSTSYNWMDVDYSLFKKHEYIHLLGNWKRRTPSFKLVLNLLSLYDYKLYSHIICLFKQKSIPTGLRYYDEYYNASGTEMFDKNIQYETELKSNVYQVDTIGSRSIEAIKFHVNSVVNNNLEYFYDLDLSRLRYYSKINITSDNLDSLKIDISKKILSLTLEGDEVKEYLKEKNIPASQSLHSYLQLVVIFNYDILNLRVNEILLLRLESVIYNILITKGEMTCSELLDELNLFYYNSNLLIDSTRLVNTVKNGVTYGLYDLHYV